ncbi:MAG: hypothetical protein P8X96_07455 [Desulfobacteraceae bacterium]
MVDSGRGALLLLISCLILFSCETRTETTVINGSEYGRKDNREWLNLDSWYNLPKTGSLSSETDDVEYIEIKKTRQNFAQALLEKESIIELSRKEAINLGFDEQSYDRLLRIFLVRSVYLNEATGNFLLSMQGNDLVVFHGSLGHSPALMKRKALMVLLPEKPANVYVYCLMAE